MIIALDDYQFRYRGRAYRITKAGMRDGKAFAEVSPPDNELEGELCRRIERDDGLSVYMGFGYICFEDEHPQELE